MGEMGGEAPSDSKRVLEGSSVDRESEAKVLLSLEGLCEAITDGREGAAAVG